MRDTDPSEDYLEKLKKRLESRFSQQDEADDAMQALYAQTHIREMWKPEGKSDQGDFPLKKVGAGLAGFMVDQDVSVLNGEPTIRVNNPGGSHKGERHCSQKLEPWLVSARKAARRRSAIQVLKVQDLRLYGRAWTEVLAEPRLWGSDKASAVEIEKMKRDNFPLVWRWISARNTWPVFDDYRQVAEVISMRKVDAEVAKERWGIEKGNEQIDVLYYWNHVYTAVYVPGNDGRVVHKWEHGMEGLPVVLFEGDPMPEDPRGGPMWRGAAYHGQELIRAIDDTLSDIRTVSRKAVIAATIVEQDVNLRGLMGAKPEELVVKDNATFNIFTGEKVYKMQTGELNPALLQFITLAKSILDQIALSRPALVGGVLSGQSAVSLETAAQRAEAELRASHMSLEDGAAEECKLFFKAVKALNKKFPESPDAVMVSPASTKYGRTEIAVTPDDVDGYEHLIQTTLRQNIPVDEGGNVTNYAVAIKSGALSAESGRERYFHHEDPLGEQDKIDKGTIRGAIVQMLTQVAARMAVPDMEQEGAAEPGAIAERARGISPDAGEALAQAYEGEGDVELANLIRGAMNKTREGRGERMTQTGGKMPV